MADDAGGLFVQWEDARSPEFHIYAMRLAADGTIAPGWVADGVPICTAPNGQGSAVMASETESSLSTSSRMRSCSASGGHGTGSAFSFVMLIEAKLVVCFPSPKKYACPLLFAYHDTNRGLNSPNSRARNTWF